MLHAQHACASVDMPGLRLLCGVSEWSQAGLTGLLQLIRQHFALIIETEKCLVIDNNSDCLYVPSVQNRR